MRKALNFFQKSSDPANMAVTDETIYEFADFRLNPRDNLLLCNDEAIPLPPKAFSILVLLLEHHGHLVRKEEVIEKIWADAFVEEAAVSRCIWTIRNALGEDSKSQRFIQTVPKRGYKFVANVTESKGADQHPNEHNVGSSPDSLGAFDTGSQPTSAVQPLNTAEDVRDEHPVVGGGPLAWYQHRPVAASAVLFVLLSLVIISGSFLLRSQSLAARDRTHFAVLPLKPVDAANRSDLYENGIADSLINRLNSVHGFVARPLSAMRKYSALDQDPIAAGREQKVDYVLASNYQIADGKIRVTAELYDVASGTIRDSYRNEQDIASIFAAQDAIAADLGNRMMTQFSGTLAGRPATRGTSNEEAYRHYQQARYLMAQSRDRGIASLEKAISIDPAYARAWAALAYAYTGGPGAAPSELENYQNSMDAARKALALEPELSEAYCALCINRMFYERNASGAEELCKKAVDIDPNSATTHSVYGIFLSTQARHDEAIAEARTAMELEPASYFPRRWHANFLYWARRYDEAIPEIRRLLEVNDGRDISRHRWLMWSYEMQGKYPEAFDALMGMIAAYQPGEEARQRYQTVYQNSGWPGILAEMEKEDGLRFNSYRRASIHAQLGNRDKAFEFMEEAYAGRLWEAAFLQVDPAWDQLRDDQRYADLANRLAAK